MAMESQMKMNTPIVQIFPMSDDYLQKGQSIGDFFQNDLLTVSSHRPTRGRFNFKNRGITAPKTSLLLFQYGGKIRAHGELVGRHGKDASSPHDSKGNEAQPGSLQTRCDQTASVREVRSQPVVHAVDASGIYSFTRTPISIRIRPSPGRTHRSRDPHQPHPVLIRLVWYCHPALQPQLVPLERPVIDAVLPAPPAPDDLRHVRMLLLQRLRHLQPAVALVQIGAIPALHRHRRHLVGEKRIEEDRAPAGLENPQRQVGILVVAPAPSKRQIVPDRVS